jgi:hypothetical protein
MWDPRYMHTDVSLWHYYDTVFFLFQDYDDHYKKKNRRYNEEVMSSYERENGFKKWPKKRRNRVNRRIICVFNSESD